MYVNLNKKNELDHWTFKKKTKMRITKNPMAGIVNLAQTLTNYCKRREHSTRGTNHVKKLN